MDFWLFLFWYQPYSATYQIYGKFSRHCNRDIHTSQENRKKPNNWAVFVWIQKSAPKKIDFLTNFIRTHLCASLDSGIESCHQSQTWQYQGATVGIFGLTRWWDFFCHLLERKQFQNICTHILAFRFVTWTICFVFPPFISRQEAHHRGWLDRDF